MNLSRKIQGSFELMNINHFPMDKYVNDGSFVMVWGPDYDKIYQALYKGGKLVDELGEHGTFNHITHFCPMLDESNLSL